MSDDPAKLTLFELTTFIEAARLKSVRKLARHLKLKPDHISKTINRLEERLRVQLFERAPSGLTLTKPGIILLSAAEKTVKASEGLFKGIATDEKPVQQYTWGSVSFLNRYLVAPSLKSIHAEIPNFKLRLMDLTPAELVVAGLKGRLQLCLHAGKLDWTSVWSTTHLGFIRWGLFASITSPLSELSSEAEVLKFPFVLPTYYQADGYELGDDFFYIPAADRISGHEASTADTALQIAASTDQLANVPHLLGRAWVEQGLVKEIKVRGRPAHKVPLYLSAKSDQITKVTLKYLINSLSQEMG